MNKFDFWIKQIIKLIIYINLTNTILIHKQFNASMMQDLCNQIKYLKYRIQ